METAVIGMTVLAFAYLYHKGMLHLKEQQMHL
jgi:hypothetical protein